MELAMNFRITNKKVGMYEAGFTLTELMVVIGILTIMLAIEL